MLSIKPFLLTILLSHLGKVVIGQETRPLLRPQLSLCQNRGQDFAYQGHRYLFSWERSDAGLKDWLDARNYCRERCMDAVAVETSGEWTSLRSAISRSPLGPEQRVKDSPPSPGKTPPDEDDAPMSIWTSGRLCDFDGCEKTDHVKPINIKGWFWSANNKKMSDTNCVSGRKGCFHGWSDRGQHGFPQPDNREFREEGIRGNEACLALLYKAFAGEGLAWHDKGCYHRMEFVCEDSDSLLSYARQKWRGQRIP